MNIQEFQNIVENHLPALIKRSSAAPLTDVFNPIGYKLRCQASIIANGKVRKKRADASIESFDPNTDGILITFEPEFELEEAPTPPPAAQPFVSVASAARPATSGLSYTSQPEHVRTVVTALDRAEAAQHQFVGLKYFRDKILPRETAAWITDESLRRLVLKDLIDRGVIEPGKVPNPQSAEFPVTSIKLNRAHPLVEEILRTSPAAASSEFRPIRQSGELASRVILKDRR